MDVSFSVFLSSTTKNFLTSAINENKILWKMLLLYLVKYYIKFPFLFWELANFPRYVHESPGIRGSWSAKRDYVFTIFQNRTTKCPTLEKRNRKDYKFPPADSPAREEPNRSLTLTLDIMPITVSPGITVTYASVSNLNINRNGWSTDRG